MTNAAGFSVRTANRAPFTQVIKFSLLFSNLFRLTSRFFHVPDLIRLKKTHHNYFASHIMDGKIVHDRCIRGNEAGSNNAMFRLVFIRGDKKMSYKNA